VTPRREGVGSSPDHQEPVRVKRSVAVTDAVRSTATRLVEPGTILPVLLISAFVLRGIWLDVPAHTLIFDEAYYVNAARVLLGLPVAEGAPYATAPIGLDPNLEHPPLGKLLIAASMVLFGDNGLAWRLPSVLAGMVTLGALYGIVRSAGGTAYLAILAVGLLAFDNLTFVHSRLGTLDMLVLAVVMVGAWLGVRSQWALAGAVIGIGLLIKLTAVYALVAMLLIPLLRAAEIWWHERRLSYPELRAAALLVGGFAVVGFVGLWILDTAFTTFTNPLDHLGHMVRYGAGLQASVEHGGFCIGISSPPWQWPFNTCQINYLRVDVSVPDPTGVVSTASSIDFRGALNPLLASAIPFACLFAAWLAWRTRDSLVRWSILWMAANFLPFVVLAVLTNRVTYLYYILPVLPALAVAVAIFLTRSGLPRFVAWGYIAAYALGFIAYFPFRQLP
jgi:dolichyl-phosphate-mannose-protein mannosyltransferase